MLWQNFLCALHVDLFAFKSADTMLFTFPNPFFNCFTCLKENLDRMVKFIGVPVLEV